MLGRVAVHLPFSLGGCLLPYTSRLFKLRAWGIGIREDISGMIIGGTDTFHIYSRNCLKGSQEKPVLAVIIKGHPNSGLGHLRLARIFF